MPNRMIKITGTSEIYKRKNIPADCGVKVVNDSIFDRLNCLQN